LESDPEPLVVEFQAGIPGSPPFFAVAAPGVRAIGYGLLARHLGVDQGFYKLQAQGPVVKDRPLNVDELRSLAKQYVAAMRAIQPEGPYYLAAMCGGCGIAEQMILQLEAHGSDVGLFAVFDTWVQEHAQSRWRFLLFNYHQRLRWLRTASARERLDWIKGAVMNRIQNWTGKAKASRPWIEAYFPENFRTPHFHAPVVLFKSPKQPYFHKDDQELGWGARSARAVEIHAVDAIHHDILRDPHLQFVSKILLSRMHPAKSHTEAASANGAVEETMVQTSVQ
jgi:thioesterase domain-containing protein